MEIPKLTIRLSHVKRRWCPHCGDVTVQVGPKPELWPSGPDDVVAGNGAYQQGTCLQCIADGGTCCSLARYNRWLAPKG
jgi:hypothetical protein